jgi:CMP-N-acetylneuraminic acid synthetase
MNIACFIPIKQFSERVKGKNFRVICGMPLYQAIITKACECGRFSKVIVDTDSREVADFALSIGAHHLPRDPELLKNTANGNDLLVKHYLGDQSFDYYFQLFATAPLMKKSTICSAVDKLVNSSTHDSVFTAISHHGFYWRAGMPISYRPDLLPRSQDLITIDEETTGLYGITKASLEKYRCRIGALPLIIAASKLEAVDLNTEDDFAYLEWLVSTQRASMTE